MICEGKTAAIVGVAGNVNNYIAALKAVGIEPVVTLDPAEAVRCGGLLLPGGGDIDPARFGEENNGSRDIDTALDAVQLAALDGFVKAGKPVLGICRGHQVVNVYFGGGLVQDLPTAQTHMARGHVDSVHSVEIAAGSVLHGLYGRSAIVNSAHHQGLAALGRGLRVTALAPDGVIEAAEHESLPVLAVQFHPERMAFAHARSDTADGAGVFRWFGEGITSA